MWHVQQNHLLVEFQGVANSFVISYRLCSRKEMWHSTFVSPYIYASNHKPEISDAFLLTFHLDSSFSAIHSLLLFPLYSVAQKERMCFK
jgi:N-glycosylase/DNA lyase